MTWLEVWVPSRSIVATLVVLAVLVLAAGLLP